jgi:putative N6-adenine-specific DNA methylase
MEEARALGLNVIEEEGGFAWTGDARSVMLANLALRIPSRIVVRLASFEARSFAELERRARKVDWGRVLSDGDIVRFRVTSRKSKLYHTGGIAQRLGESVSRALPRAQIGVTPSDDDEADIGAAQLIVVRFVRDHCTVSADTSGELLHRRGYRKATAKAPLRETIAAAMLHASGWRHDAPLVDPFCGAGTIPIEAALLARRIPPGRSFAIEGWPNLSTSVGASVREQLAQQIERTTPLSILGSDRDAGAITAAKANAERAGVTDAIAFSVRSVSDAEFGEAPGWVVSNPPYGVRVGETDRVRDLWGRFGRVLRERASGWTVVLLSPDPALDRQLGFPVRVLATTSNGGIPVRIITGTA